VTRLRAERSGIRIRSRIGDFYLLLNVQTGPMANTASYSMDSGVLSPGIKRPGRDIDHSPPFIAEIKNWWSCTSTLRHVFMA